MKISLLWTAAIIELRFMKSSAGTEMAEVTGIVEAMMMVLVSEKWLLEVVVILNLVGAALTAAIIQS